MPAGDAGVRRWAKRAIAIPLFVALALAVVALAPFALALAAAIDLARPRRFALTRAVAFAAVLMPWQGLCLGAALALGLLRVHRPLQVRCNTWLMNVCASVAFLLASAILGFRVTLLGGLPEPDRRPLLVFIRHASMADGFLPHLLLGLWRGWRCRYVLKREMADNPVTETLCQRQPNRFIRRGAGVGEREAERIGTLMTGLTPIDAVVIWPEGTFFSPEKREAKIAELRRRGATAELALAESLHHTLSPLRSGARALLDANPGADLLFVGHAGLERLSDLRAIVDGSLVGAELVVRAWHVPYERIPADAAGREALVGDAWRAIDRFVGERKAEAS